MIKRTQHSLKFITAKKREMLDNLFVEYQRVVNEFIGLYWNEKKLASKATATEWRKVTTWLCGKAVKCAYRQAIQIVKATQDKNKKRTYKAYQRVFAYAKKKNKPWAIVTQKWSEWSVGKKFRDRVKFPVFNGNSIDLNSDLVTIYESPKMKSFDLAVRLGSIFGNRISLLLPTKKHALFNKHINNGYSVNSSVQLRRIDDKLYVNLFLEKEKPEIKSTGKVVGIDVGIKKLMSTSEGEFFGKEIEAKIQKLKRRKRGSHNFKQTIAEIKSYIGQQVNKLKLDDVCAVVLEDLEVQNMSKRGGKSSKEHRRTLGNWNSRLLFGRVNNRCDENRVFVAFIPPEYTSQICSSCGVVCKESRSGERYECKHCVASLDADYDASINIRNRFLSRGRTVSCEQKQV
jgi:transposase